MCQEDYDEIKDVASKETMLHCPNYELQCLMFLDASDIWLGAHVSHVEHTNVDESLN